eukprot:1045937-Pelagomonas_calceolata.AAC.2
MFPHFKSWPPKRSRLFHQQPSISIVECIVRSRVWYILCNASYFPALERSKYTIALTTDNQEVPPQRCNFTAASASKADAGSVPPQISLPALNLRYSNLILECSAQRLVRWTQCPWSGVCQLRMRLPQLIFQPTSIQGAMESNLSFHNPLRRLSFPMKAAIAPLFSFNAQWHLPFLYLPSLVLKP